jgi:hypothetical protein
MNTDRELLEAAAKAMRDSGDPNFRNYEVYADRVCLELGSSRGAIIGYWRPLTDNGDAFRLMVNLRITVTVTDHGAVAYKDNLSWLVTFDETMTVETAARRAIVRVAAEIGRNKT